MPLAPAESDTATSSSSARSASSRALWRASADARRILAGRARRAASRLTSPAPQAQQRSDRPATIDCPRTASQRLKRESRQRRSLSPLPLRLQRQASEAATGLTRAQESTSPAVSCAHHPPAGAAIFSQATAVCSQSRVRVVIAGRRRGRCERDHQCRGGGTGQTYAGRGGAGNRCIASCFAAGAAATGRQCARY